MPCDNASCMWTVRCLIVTNTHTQSGEPDARVVREREDSEASRNFIRCPARRSMAEAVGTRRACSTCCWPYDARASSGEINRIGWAEPFIGAPTEWLVPAPKLRAALERRYHAGLIPRDCQDFRGKAGFVTPT